MDERESDAARASALAADLRGAFKKLTRVLRAQAQTGELTSSQISVIGRLERDGPATVTRLARGEGVRPQSMGAIVSTLDSAGLVSGAPDPADGRQTILSLTVSCRQWIEAGRAARQDFLSRAILTKLDAHEQKELARAVDLLGRLVDP